ncbi:hypothetical protein ACPPVO_27540 [Dactylosporangium sp. McL0621]|uniref:hypothetical protein n=1 Tax=Dactylosporangium sp. McL0621 TaxID=3415678 RepID=UPI003CE68266
MQPVDIRSGFESTGVVRLHRAFTADQAAAMRNALWQHAERQAGLQPTDPATWAGSTVLNWQSVSRDPVFRPLVDNQAVRDALDAIFGPGSWRRPRAGAQILFSLPEPEPWVLPDGWHMDCGFDHATWPVPSVKLFAFAGAATSPPGLHGIPDQAGDGTYRDVQHHAVRPCPRWVPADRTPAQPL